MTTIKVLAVLLLATSSLPCQWAKCTDVTRRGTGVQALDGSEQLYRWPWQLNFADTSTG